MFSIIEKIQNVFKFTPKEILYLLVMIFAILNFTSRISYIEDSVYRGGYKAMLAIENGKISLDENDPQFIGTKPALQSDLEDACLNSKVKNKLEDFFDTSEYCKLTNVQ